MKSLQSWTFPTTIVAIAIIFTPLIDIQLFGDYTALTYVVESTCAALGLLLVGVACYNSWKDSHSS
jgi:hypothetical protein